MIRCDKCHREIKKRQRRYVMYWIDHKESICEYCMNWQIVGLIKIEIIK